MIENETDQLAAPLPPKNRKTNQVGQLFHVLYAVKMPKTAVFNVNVVLSGYTLNVLVSQTKNMVSLEGVPLTFFCKLCRPQVSLSLKFFNEIKDKQTELDERLQELESKLAPISGNSNQDTMSQENNSSNANPVQTATTNSHYNLQHDRKFNIVMYGIDECEKGAPRNERSGRDLSSVIETITKVNANVSPLSIRDLHRLGKYQEQSRRPRPILIKFNRAIDVSILLSQTSTLPSGIRIKPDMNPEERQIESLLLKERWSLIQKDINRKVIKIRGNRIFVNNKLHGEVKNRNLVLSQAVLPDDQMESSSN